MDTSPSHEAIIDQEFERGGPLSLENTVASYWKLEDNKPEISLQKPSFSKFTDTASTRERDHGGCSVEEAFEKLDNLIGLDGVKTHLRKQIALNQLSASRGSSFPVSHHLAMIGPPGTGKSTVARLIGEIYAKRGIVSEERFLEVDRSSLVGQYIGQTAGKTAKVIERARGGVLFVDEAYALENGSDRDFGREAVAILLKAMEDYRGDLVVILAGYPDEMQALLQSNPGLDSRIPQRNRLFFPSYSVEEIVSIAQMIAKQGGYSLNDSASQLVGRASQEWAKEPGFGNARWVRDIVEGACLEHAYRTQGAQSPDFELREEDILLPKLISPKSCGFS
jgi:SpoVK/Ycf46/Vps4 family AAA+-type ATPase